MTSNRPLPPLDDRPIVDAVEQRRGGAPATVDSGHLRKGAREVLIRHGGETYRLRQTQAGKLILTK